MVIVGTDLEASLILEHELWELFHATKVTPQSEHEAALERLLSIVGGEAGRATKISLFGGYTLFDCPGCENGDEKRT